MYEVPNMIASQQLAHAHFQKLGWPHRKLEGWQWCDWTQNHPQFEQLKPALPQLKPHRAIKHKVQEAQPIADNLSDSSNADSINAMTALNIAYSQQTLQIIIPDHQKITEPVMLEHLEGCAQFELILGEGAQLTLYEHLKSAGFTSILAKIKLKKGASLTHFKLFDQPENAFAYTHHHVEVAQDALWELALIGGGAQRQRIDHHVLLQGQGAQAQMRSALIAQAQRHCDIGWDIHHQVKACQSLAFCHAILADQAQASFRVNGYIAPNASKSNLRQRAQAVLLDQRAVMNAKPELAIYNDDVQCAHGVAIGALDLEALFYLGTRGVEQSLAERMLLEAFITNLFHSDKSETYQKPLQLAFERLERLRA